MESLRFHYKCFHMHSKATRIIVREYNLSDLYVFSGQKFLIQVEVKLLYKYVTIYRVVMHLPRLDWCKMMEDDSKNKMFWQLIQVMKNSAGSKVIHKCPYTVGGQVSADFEINI